MELFGMYWMLSNIGFSEMAFILISCILIPIFLLRRKVWKVELPLKWPLIGMLPSLLWNFRHLNDWVTHLLNFSGATFTLEIPLMKRVFTADAGNVEYMLKTRFHSFVKSKYLKSVFDDLFGDNNLFLQDGHFFNHFSSLSTSALHSTSFRNYSICSTISFVHDRLLPLLRSASDDELIINLHDVFRRFLFDITCWNGMGFDPKSLLLELPPVPSLTALDEGIEACMHRLLMPALCWRTMRYLGIGMERRVPAARKIVDHFLSQIIAFRKKNRVEYSVDDYNEGRDMDFLSIVLLHEQEINGGVPACLAFLRDFSLNMVISGQTTHVALSWFFWLLDQHRGVEQKIVQEIRSILNRRPTSQDRNDPSPFSMEEIKEMKYLQAALSESLRLYPPVPINLVEAAEADVLPDGTKLERGSIVIYSIYSACRLQSVWREDCGEFKPERWIKDGKAVKGESEFRYPVFNGGPRRCTGK